MDMLTPANGVKMGREFWIDGNEHGSDKVTAYLKKPNAEQIEFFTHVIEYSALLAERERSAKLVEASLKLVEDIRSKDDYNSVDCIIACMAEGEGSDYRVYRKMSSGALVKLRKLLVDYELVLTAYHEKK